jgi:hypothetical protein
MQVLRIHPGNLKALYRRGQAYKELGSLKVIIEDFWSCYFSSSSVDVS